MEAINRGNEQSEKHWFKATKTPLRAWLYHHVTCALSHQSIQSITSPQILVSSCASPVSESTTLVVLQAFSKW